METNLRTDDDPALHDAAEALMEAAMRYWREYRRVTGGAAVVWVKDTDGRMVILTRGEYQGTLMHNIDRLQDGSEIRGFETPNARPKEEAMNEDPWKHRSSGMKCGGCMWFVVKPATDVTTTKPLDSRGELGRCRRHAPTMNEPFKEPAKEHQPEPWTCHRTASGYSVDSAKGKNVAQLITKRHAYADADARRIVACVNACAGIATEALERDGATVILQVPNA